MKKVLSFDIGGTKIASALIGEDGSFQSEVLRNPTPKSAAEISDLFKKIISENYSDIAGVAFSTAGAVNMEGTKITSFVGNLPLDYNKTDFVALTDKPVLVENDANSAGWAEYALGAAKGCDNAVVLTIGTGVGSGIIVDGKLLKGKSGAAGEMHFPIDSGKKRKCKGCGMYDCFESFASGTGLGLFAKEIMGETTTTYDVINLKKQGDAKAMQTFSVWQDYLTKGMIMLGNIFDPQVIVLSGSMAQFIEYENVTKAINSAILTQPLEVRPAQFANDSGMLGAAMLLHQKISSK